MQGPLAEKTLELPRNAKEIILQPGSGAWGSSHLRSQAQNPKLGLRDPGRQDSAQGKRSACIWAEAEKVPNNNSFNPSMKKETHCVYRYRAWPPKHESTFGSGAPGQGCWKLAIYSGGELGCFCLSHSVLQFLLFSTLANLKAWWFVSSERREVGQESTHYFPWVLETSLSLKMTQFYFLTWVTALLLAYALRCFAGS